MQRGQILRTLLPAQGLGLAPQGLLARASLNVDLLLDILVVDLVLHRHHRSPRLEKQVQQGRGGGEERVTSGRGITEEKVSEKDEDLLDSRQRL